jgi:hypothetical protein
MNKPPMQLLADAMQVYYAVACSVESRIANQSPSWEPARTPYDHAAALVRSLLPMVYGERGIDPQWLWDQMLPDWTPELPSVDRAEWFWLLHQLSGTPHPLVEMQLRLRLAELESVGRVA